MVYPLLNSFISHHRRFAVSYSKCRQAAAASTSITTLQHLLHNQKNDTTLQDTCTAATDDTLLLRSVDFTLNLSGPMSCSGLCSEENGTPFAPFNLFGPMSCSDKSLDSVDLA